MSNNLIEEIFLDRVLKILAMKNDKLPQTSEHVEAKVENVKRQIGEEMDIESKANLSI